MQHTHTYVYAHTHSHTYTYATHLYTHVDALMYTHTHAYTLVHTRTRTHTCTHMQQLRQTGRHTHDQQPWESFVHLSDDSYIPLYHTLHIRVVLNPVLSWPFLGSKVSVSSSGKQKSCCLFFLCTGHTVRGLSNPLIIETPGLCPGSL